VGQVRGMNETMISIERRYVYEDVDRYGNVRTYFWRGMGHRKVRIHEKRGTEEFDKHYHDLMRESAAGAFKPPPRNAPKPGTLRWLCVEYFQSAAFKQLDLHATQRVTKLIVETMLREPIAPGAQETFADCPLDRFGVKQARVLRDRKADRPGSANNRVKRLRSMYAWALANEIPGVTANPAERVPLLKAKKAGGFPVWTPADIDRFEVRHGVGTKARLALALLCFTGARRSDIVLFGRQHLKDARLHFVMQKGRNRAPLKVDIPLHPDLLQVIEASPTGDLTFLMTEQGRPFTAAGFTNWFRKRCQEAGLSNLSAHGLRKAAATRAAERGATTSELMGIFGWRNISQAEIYTRSAERGRLAGRAVHLLGTEQAQIFPTAEAPGEQVGKIPAKK
jgi:integrase